MTPGPTPVPAEVLLAQGSPIVYHRGPGYAAVLRECTEGLQWLLNTSNDVLTYTASGSGGMESAVVNLFSPGRPGARGFGRQLRRAVRRRSLRPTGST